MKTFLNYTARILGLLLIASFLLGARVCQEDYDFAAQSERATPTPTPTSTPVPSDDDDDDDEDDEEDLIPSPVVPTPTPSFIDNDDDDLDDELDVLTKKSSDSFLRGLSELGASGSPAPSAASGIEGGGNWLGRAFIDSDPATCDEMVAEFINDIETFQISPEAQQEFLVEWKKAKGLSDECDPVLVETLAE